MRHILRSICVFAVICIGEYCAVVSKIKMKTLLKSIANDFSHWNTKMICRAGAIAALYAVVTWLFGIGNWAYGPFQIRPTEALTVLPLFFPEAVPALYLGCILANFFSSYGVYDIFLGSLATLFAAFFTYLCGRVFKNDILKIITGGIFPVAFNAFIIPAVWILAGSPDVVYWAEVASMAVTEAVWYYVLGTMLYFAVEALRKRGVKVFTSPVHARAGAKGSLTAQSEQKESQTRSVAEQNGGAEQYKG